MSKVAHTPGPWRAIKAPHGVIDILDGRDRDIVTVYGGGVETESQEANAHLMAAAPDLLDALRTLTDNIEHAFPGLAHLGPVAFARSAIAKAEGRQP